MPVRPVSVMLLEEQDFLRDQELTGVVSSYRQEDVGLEVKCRITMRSDEGLEVRGPTFDESGKQIRRGT